MRKMPQIPVVDKSKLMTATFRGYNHNEIISDGEMFDTKNLSGDLYPVLTTRKKRGVTTPAGTLNGIFSLNGLVEIRGPYVYYKGENTGLEVSTESDMMPKRFVSMGAFVCIWPDRKYFNTLNFADKGNMRRYWAAADNVTGDPPADPPQAMMCRGDGTNYDMTQITVSATAPENPSEGDLWMDQSGENDVLRQYSVSTGEWVEVPSVYVKISGNMAGWDLNEYDTVEIKGAKPASNSATSRIKKQISELNGSHIVYGAGQDYVIVAGLISAVTTLDHEGLEINREVPDLDYVCESNNRLWGCKYGVPADKIRDWEDYAKNVNVELCNSSGTVYSSSEVKKGDSPPANPSIGDLWLKTDAPPYYKETMWECTGTGGTYGSWKKIKSYIKISGTNIGKGLKAGDTVVMSGFDYPSPTTVLAIMRMEFVYINGERLVQKAEDHYIVIEGTVSANHYGETQRTMYQDDFYVHADRKTFPEDFMNEIRACKLGDFKNWSTFMGLSSDSYAVSIGTEGAFTGAITQRGIPVFFKENSITKIYGNNPSSFQVQTNMYKGIQEGSWRSAVTIDEMVIYKSTDGIMMYDGSNATCISEQLGTDVYSDARAGALGDKYYISMEKNGEWSLFTYDTKKGIWYREDATQAMCFAQTAGDLFYIDEAANKLVSVKGTEGTQEGEIAWRAVFGISGIEYRPNGYGSLARADHWGHQYLSRFDLRMYVEEGTTMDIYLKYDSEADWHHAGSIGGNRMKTFVMPVIPRRCDHMQMKIEGTGEFRIYSICKTMEAGSDGGQD